MNNELTLWDQPPAPAQTAFNWDETFAETKKLVEEDAELTATIDDAMVKRFHGRVKIGFNLMALQKEHSKNRYGNFTTQVLPELGIDPRFSQRCISVARLYQNSIATHGSRLDLFDLPLSIRTWETLASHSGQTVVKQLESGEIKPTQEDIKKALEEERAKAAAEKQRAEQLKQELEAKEREHSLFKEDAEYREQTAKQMYTVQVQALKQRVTELENKPVPQPEKVTVYEDTPETKAKLSSLKAENVSLEEQIERMQGRLVDTAREAEKYERMFQQTREANSKYAEENKRLSEEAKRRFIESQIELDQLRVRQEWRKIVEKFLEDIAGFMAKVPTLIDREAFESDDWSRYDQCVHVAEQALNLLKSIRTAQSSHFIDATPMVTVPAVFVEG